MCACMHIKCDIYYFSSSTAVKMAADILLNISWFEQSIEFVFISLVTKQCTGIVQTFLKLYVYDEVLNLECVVL